MNTSLLTPSQPEPCKGLLFKGRVSSWFDGKNIHTKKSLMLLKRKSCSGCEYCDWQYEYLKEDSACFSDEDIIGDIEDGKLYTTKFSVVRDFETGFEEVEGIEFIEVEE
jgi:hypothetical protein